MFAFVATLLGTPAGRYGFGALGALVVAGGLWAWADARGHERGYIAGHQAGHVAGWNAAGELQRKLNVRLAETGLDARARRRACVENTEGTWDAPTGTCIVNRRGD